MLDMTNGNSLKQIIIFAIPLFISSIFQQLYNICDTMMLGKMVGIEALAAAGASMPLFFLIVIVSIGFTRGLTVMVGQSFGAKNFSLLRKYIASSFILSLTFVSVIAVCNYFMLEQILIFMNVPDNIVISTISYLSIICYASFFIVLFNLVSAILQAVGDSKTPLYFLILSVILNIVLNYIFIKFYGLGIRGSAYGTGGAMFITGILILLYAFYKYKVLLPNKTDWLPSLNIYKQSLIIALPMAFQFSIFGISISIIQTLCNGLGFEAIVAMSSCLRIEQVAGQLMMAIGGAVASFVAQNYGAGNIERIKKGVLLASKLSFFVGVVLVVLIYSFSKELIMLFLPNDINDELLNILGLSKLFLKINICFYFLMGQMFIYKNACLGMGNSIIPLISTIIEVFARATLGVYVVYKFNFLGLCFLSPITCVIGASCLYIGYLYSIKSYQKKLSNKNS